MKQFVRTFVLLPALILALVAIPTVVFSAAGGADGGVDAFIAGLTESAAPGGTISPLPSPTPDGTVPTPLPTSTPRPIVYPTATPSVDSDLSTLGEKIYVNGQALIKVIGDRLSPTIYGYTTRGWLYRTDNDGEDWYLVTKSPDVQDFIMNAADPNVLYSGEGADCESGARQSVPMYKSIDGGETFEKVANGINLKPLLTAQYDEDLVFAADCDMLFVSDDGGDSWSAKPDRSQAALWNQHVVVAMASASLTGDPEPEFPHWDQLYAAGADEDGIGVVGFSGDMGDTWVSIVDDTDVEPFHIRAVTADLRTGGQLWFVDSFGVWSTTDFGLNWSFSARGLGNVIDRGIPGAKFGLNDIEYQQDLEMLYLATVKGLYGKSYDGKTWLKIGGTSEVRNLLLTETALDQLWLNTSKGVYLLPLDN
jgi:photosystem II stability/assembly factor-like uncharacterized protein